MMKSILAIKPYILNAKQHPQKQVKQIAASIKEFGFNQPIVTDKAGVIIVGHGRYLAAKELGLTEVPVLQLDLTEEQVKAYRLADNKLNESEWDMKLVIDELKSLTPVMFDLTGFDKDLLLEPNSKDDEVPDTPDEPTTKLGDIYQLGAHRLMCGDSTLIYSVEKLMNGQKADMVFTDPPYGMGVVKNRKVGADFGIAQKGNYSEVIGDATIDTAKKFYDASIKIGFSKFIIWGGNYFIQFLPFSTGWLVWDKRGDSGIKNTFADGELAWTNCQKQIRIYKQLWNGMIREGEHEKRVHPTQKPIMTLQKILNDFTVEKQIIYDGFLGSGSTLIACEKTDRICYGMELDPKYCDVIVKRWEEFTGQKAVLL